MAPRFGKRPNVLVVVESVTTCRQLVEEAACIAAARSAGVAVLHLQSLADVGRFHDIMPFVEPSWYCRQHSTVKEVIVSTTALWAIEISCDVIHELPVETLMRRALECRAEIVVMRGKLPNNRLQSLVQWISGDLAPRLDRARPPWEVRLLDI